jgi:D-sedoheptulose 7-phosphate isomerase
MKLETRNLCATAFCRLLETMVSSSKFSRQKITATTEAEGNPLTPENSSTSLLTRSLNEHLEAMQALLDSRLADIDAAGRLICQALRAGNKILLCGNGGSAADAQHIAAEFVGRYELQRQAFPAISLTTDTSALTALSNDYGYEEVFARQVEALAAAGDVLIAISTSGKSPNIVKAAEKARAIGCKTIALTGCAGEPLASQCDLAIVVPSERTSRVQEAHITIGHLWCEMVDSSLAK